MTSPPKGLLEWLNFQARVPIFAMRITCETCGKEHDLDDISFGTNAPLQWDLLSEEERSRSMLSDEQCEIESSEGSSFYIRGCLEIPIRGSGRIFSWGVWCSLSEKSFMEIAEHWNDPDRTSLGPYFGWLHKHSGVFRDEIPQDESPPAGGGNPAVNRGEGTGTSPGN